MNDEHRDLKPGNLPPLAISRMERVPLLDHGYAELIECWGSDEDIITSARMSTAKGFLGWGPNHGQECAFRGHPKTVSDPCDCPDAPGDEKLLRYLWENAHSTPFEFAGLTVEIQAPLMVFREWHRHRTASYSERSARYTPLPNSNYLPTPDRLFAGVGGNKQTTSADGAAQLDMESAIDWLDELSDVYEHAEKVYQHGLKIGVPKELARLCVPVARYSVMRASTDLRNWLGFCKLRMAKGAQYEIRVYAEAVHQMLTRCFPRTLALFDEGMKK